MKKKKDNRGGAGRGQGRKKGKTFKEPTKPVRVPFGCLEAVDELIERYRESKL